MWPRVDLSRARVVSTWASKSVRLRSVSLTWSKVWMPIWCPSSSIRRTTSPLFSIWAPMRKKVAFTPRSERPSSRRVVVERRGPSSKVRAISFCPAGTVGQGSPSPASSTASASAAGPGAAGSIHPARAKSSSSAGTNARARRRQEVRSIPPAAFPKSFGLSMRCWRDCLRCKFCYCARGSGSPLRESMYS